MPESPLSQMVGSVSPALVSFTAQDLTEELWHRPGLCYRGRCVVTIATLVSRNAQTGYDHYFARALDHGVAPAELSGLMTHLAFYAGWPNAFGAVAALARVFQARGISSEDLPRSDPTLMDLAEAVPDEAVRRDFITANVATVSAALAHFTDGLLYQRVWCRPDLTPRDRSLATFAALAVQAQGAFLPFYLGRAVSKGFTAEEVGELLAHTAFYAGWGNAMLAVGAVKTIFDARA